MFQFNKKLTALVLLTATSLGGTVLTLTVAVSPAAADNSSSYLPYINQLRAQTGAGPLSYSQPLFDHSWKNAHTLVTQYNGNLKHFGLGGVSLGENLAGGSRGSNWDREMKQAIDMWQAEGRPSSGINHFSIMHNPKYKTVACSTDVKDWNNHANGFWVTACNFR
jgi:uncharacterized protein YkwD